MSDNISSIGTLSSGERGQLANWRSKIGTHLEIKRQGKFLNYYWHKTPKKTYLNFAEIKNIFKDREIGWDFYSIERTNLDSLGNIPDPDRGFGPAVEINLSDDILTRPPPQSAEPDRPDRIDIDPEIPTGGNHPGGGSENENGHNKNFPYSEGARKLLDL